MESCGWGKKLWIAAHGLALPFQEAMQVAKLLEKTQ
jgi:hypothetical protein